MLLFLSGFHNGSAASNENLSKFSIRVSFIGCGRQHLPLANTLRS